MNWLDTIPANLHGTAEDAVSHVFGTAAVSAIEPVTGGASGAVTYRVDVDSRSYLLRMETRRGPLRNPHQYTCMRIAAEAGIAPALRYADDGSGVAIMDFVTQHPLDTYPGGPLGLIRALGEMVRRLQTTVPFPALADYRFVLEKGLSFLRTAFAPGLLDPHQEVLDAIRQAYPWDASPPVSSHNDPNPRNILFDGERLWLIDWESAYRNDPLTDVAILAENHAASPELEAELLRSWLGHEPDRRMQARLRLMRQMTRLYYATLMLMVAGKPTEPVPDLAAPSPDEFRKRIASGQLQPASSETKILLCKMLLAGFLAGALDPDFRQLLAVAQDG